MRCYPDEPDFAGVVVFDDERRLLVDLGTGHVLAVCMRGITAEEGEALAGALNSMRRTPEEWFVDFADVEEEAE